MKIAVIGAGAVGGYFGGRLVLSGNDVTFLVRGQTAEVLRKSPLRVDSIKGDFQVPVRAMDHPRDVGVVDVVLVAVKAWQIPEAAAAITKMPGGDSVVVPLQNGMDAPAQMAAVLGPGRVTGGLCRIVASLVGPGHIRHEWAEPSVAFGELEPVANRARLVELRGAFETADVRCDIPLNIAEAMWKKFLFIAPWGSLGAVTRLPVGALRTDPALRARLVVLLEEVAAIAWAEGANLGADSVYRTLAILDGLPPETTSSMQRDIMAGRPSELEAQTGAVMRFGLKNGVATPQHAAIYAELLAFERKARSSN